MQNIKNFRLVEPNEEMLEKFKDENGDIKDMPLFLRSENDLDWYECQPLFSDDTVKIMYDSNGVIKSVVDAPVPTRENTYAVSMFFPVDMSVAEIAGSLPDGFEMYSGLWVFDENTSTVYKRQLTPKEHYDKENDRFKALLRATTYAAFPLQSALALGSITPEQQSMLNELYQFAIDLADTDLTASPVVWPPLPVSVKLPL